MKKRIFFFFIALTLATQSFAFAETSEQITASTPGAYEKFFEMYPGAGLNYLLTLPKDFDNTSDEKRPLLVFLHGSGERGKDFALLKKAGIPKIYDKIENFPFVTISPQCPINANWDNYLYVVNDIIDKTVKEFGIDPDRIYLTGLSMGGRGTWHMAMKYPDKFAAIIPIAGYGNVSNIANLKHIPVWAFHGKLDTNVPIQSEQVLVDALNAAGGDVTFSVIENAVHDVWTDVYNNEKIYEWLLQHKRYIPEDYTDTSTHWAKEHIQILSALNIVKGYPDGSFQPENSVSVAEFLKMIVTANGIVLESGSDYWASTYIEEAKRLELIDENSFDDYSRPITRLEMTKIISTLIPGDITDQMIEKYSKYISDFDSIPAKDQKAVLNVFLIGIIRGYEDSSFRPDGIMTRAEGAVAIVRLLRKDKRG